MADQQILPIAVAALAISLIFGVGLLGFSMLILCLWYKTRRQLEVLSESEKNIPSMVEGSLAVACSEKPAVLKFTLECHYTKLLSYSYRMCLAV